MVDKGYNQCGGISKWNHDNPSEPDLADRNMITDCGEGWDIIPVMGSRMLICVWKNLTVTEYKDDPCSEIGAQRLFFDTSDGKGFVDKIKAWIRGTVAMHGLFSV